MQFMSRTIGIGVLLIALIASGAAARGQSAEEFYRGRTIEFITGGDAGTTYDFWARLIGKYMSKYMPGHPTFLVKAMPGGGHIKATNYLYAAAPKDGTSIGMVSSFMPTATVLKTKDTLQADFTNFAWIGSPDHSQQVCLARADVAIKKGEDLFTQSMTVGGAGAGSGISLLSSILRDVLDLKLNLIEGYKSAGDVLLAIERGEIDGICQTYQGTVNLRPDWISSGKVRVLFNLEKDPIPGTNAPSVYSLVETDEQRQVLMFFELSAGFGRPIIAPPQTPQERVDALRSAFDQAMADPALVAEAKQQVLDPAPVSAARLNEVFNEIRAMPRGIIQLAARYL